MATISSSGVSSSASGSALMSISGVVSGIDTESVLSKLEAISRQSITRLQNQKTALNKKYQAWADANTRILAIQQKATDLTKLADKMAVSATSSDSSVTVTADKTAATGSYSFHVDSVATYHQLTSQSYANADNIAIGSGTFSITTNNTTTDITVDDTMTLEGLRDAINAKDCGAKAFIVNDGSTSGSYRLVLTSETLGSSGEIAISSNLAGGTSPNFVELQTATDAQITFGSGANQFSVTRSSNTITDLIPGTTINLSSDSQGKSVTLNLSTNYDSVKKAINDFATQYNAYVDFVDQQNTYNSDTDTTGTLFGEYTLDQVSSELADSLSMSVPGLASAMNNVFDIGIKTDDTGKIVVDDAALTTALKSDPASVMKLFGNVGASSNTAVTFISATNDTVESNTGYSIFIEQSPRKAQLTIDSTGDGLSATLAQDETLTLNGQSITLTQSMTRNQVIAAINAKSSLTGIEAILTDSSGNGSGNYLTLRRTSAGSTLGISVVSDTANASSTEIGTTAITAATPGANNYGIVGLDVKGKIDGVEAQGYGDSLTSTSGKSKGLVVQIAATATGDCGSMTYARGIGSKLQYLLGFITDSATGSISSLQKTLQQEMDDLDSDITEKDAAITRETDRMRTAFTNMEEALSELQTQSSKLSSFIASLSNS